MLLIDMEIPACCEDCPICYDFMCCPITDTHVDYATMDEKRLPNCPLRELHDGGNADESSN